MHESWPKLSQRNAKDWPSAARNGRFADQLESSGLEISQNHGLTAAPAGSRGRKLKADCCPRLERLGNAKLLF
jgi:hypothetical protein